MEEEKLCPFRDGLNRYLDEYTRKDPKSKRWEIVDSKALEGEKLYIFELARQDEVSPVEGAEPESTPYEFHSEPMLGWLVKFRTKRREKAAVENSNRVTIVQADVEDVEDLSLFLKRIPSLKKCRSAAMNLFGLFLAVAIFALIFFPFFAEKATWPSSILDLVPNDVEILGTFTLSFHALIGVLIALQVMRINVGINFLDFDSTYAQALSNTEDEGRIPRSIKTRFDRIARFGLYAAGVLIPLLIRNDLTVALYFSWAVIAFAPVLYDILFCKELRSDSEHSFWFILIGDVSFLLASLSLFDWAQKTSFFDAGIFSLVFFIAIVLEFIYVYKQSIKLSFQLAGDYFRDGALR